MGRLELYQLSGENYRLSRAELIATLESTGANIGLEEEDPPLVVLENQEDIYGRLALCHNIYEHLFSTDLDELDDAIEDFHWNAWIPAGAKFKVRTHIRNQGSTRTKQSLEERIGDMIDAEVDLSDPDVEITAFVRKRAHVGILIESVDRSAFDARIVHKRPFFSPISIHPKYARAAVNLTRVKPGQTVLDPFCGTGGILIEAACMGMRAIGSDIDAKMIDGTRKNMEHYGLDVSLIRVGVEDIAEHMGEVDAVVTDPPYGRSSSTKKRMAGEVVESAFNSVSHVLKDGGRMSVVLPGTDLIELGENYLTLEDSYSIRIHKSLTRHFCVYRK